MQIEEIKKQTSKASLPKKNYIYLYRFVLILISMSVSFRSHTPKVYVLYTYNYWANKKSEKNHYQIKFFFGLIQSVNGNANR